MAEVIHLPQDHLPVNGGKDQHPLPSSLHITLTVHDRDTISELCAIGDEAQRAAFALSALRIGVLALRQAQGQLDAEVVKRECQRLLGDIETSLKAHALRLNDRLGLILEEYFDPNSGKFEERVNRLMKKDGDLEQLLRRQLGSQDSELCKTLALHFGNESPLMKLLDPDQSKGLLSALRKTLEDQLTDQRKRVLREFSLDNEEGALSRLLGQITDSQGRFTRNLQDRLDEVVKEFSLDEEDSALSRLVKNVEAAQERITSEFSLDDETSALSRLKGILENTNQAINDNLTLDQEDSALSRLRRELTDLLTGQHKAVEAFQKELKTHRDQVNLNHLK